MWDFLRKGSAQLEDLEDIVNLADNTFTEVVKYFGEDDRNMSSTEFYGIFKTFLTSYRVRLLRAILTAKLTDELYIFSMANRNASRTTGQYWRRKRRSRDGSKRKRR